MSESAPSPDGRVITDIPTDGILSDAKTVFDIGKSTVDIVRGVSSEVAADTFQIVVNDVHSTTGTPGSDHDRTLGVSLTVKNVSPHGVYIEDVYLEQHQTREGVRKPAVYTVYLPERSTIGVGEGPMTQKWNGPVRLGFDQQLNVRIDVDLQPDTWPAVDSYGIVGFRVTKLDQDAQRPRTIFFAIRR